MGKTFYWLKLKNDFFGQREIKKLRRIAGGDTFTIIYLKMQLLSIKNGGIITFEGTESSLEEQLSIELDEEPENVKLTLAFLRINSLIEPVSESEYLLNKVPEMVGSETDAAERMRKMRNNVTPQLQTVTNCYTEIEKSKSTELENRVQNTEKESEPKQGKKSNGNDSNSDELPRSKTKPFLPPSLSEVTDYCQEKNYSIDPEAFIAYYNSNGWMVGSHKMKSWKDAVVTWAKRSNGNYQVKPTYKKELSYAEKMKNYVEALNNEQSRNGNDAIDAEYTIPKF